MGGRLCGNWSAVTESMDEKGPDKPRAHRRTRLSRERRREEILKSAELLFGATGLRSTTTSALAKAAGISEAVLYRHFGAKQKLFEKVVERNSQERLGSRGTVLFDPQASAPRVH